MRLKSLKLLILCFFVFSCSSKVIYKNEIKETNLIQVREVLSGDTISLEDGRIIKYLGIEAPKYGEAYFENATEANRKLIKTGLVIIKQDKKREDNSYYVYTPRIGKIYCFVNKELIQFGCVKVMRSEHEYLKDFLELEKYAKENKKGIWANN